MLVIYLFILAAKNIGHLLPFQVRPMYYVSIGHMSALFATSYNILLVRGFVLYKAISKINVAD
jgi:hypothetical protein